MNGVVSEMGLRLRERVCDAGPLLHRRSSKGNTTTLRVAGRPPFPQRERIASFSLAVWWCVAELRACTTQRRSNDQRVGCGAMARHAKGCAWQGGARPRLDPDKLAVRESGKDNKQRVDYPLVCTAKACVLSCESIDTRCSMVLVFLRGLVPEMSGSL
jgi:hypothetical protein